VPNEWVKGMLMPGELEPATKARAETAPDAIIGAPARKVRAKVGARGMTTTVVGARTDMAGRYVSIPVAYVAIDEPPF
jgi:hypothetical protein